MMRVWQVILKAVQKKPGWQLCIVVYLEGQGDLVCRFIMRRIKVTILGYLAYVLSPPDTPGRLLGQRCAILFWEAWRSFFNQNMCKTII